MLLLLILKSSITGIRPFCKSSSKRWHLLHGDRSHRLGRHLNNTDDTEGLHRQFVVAVHLSNPSKMMTTMTTTKTATTIWAVMVIAGTKRVFFATHMLITILSGSKSGVTVSDIHIDTRDHTAPQQHHNHCYPQQQPETYAHPRVDNGSMRPRSLFPVGNEDYGAPMKKTKKKTATSSKVTFLVAIGTLTMILSIGIGAMTTTDTNGTVVEGAEGAMSLAITTKMTTTFITTNARSCCHRQELRRENTPSNRSSDL